MNNAEMAVQTIECKSLSRMLLRSTPDAFRVCLIVALSLIVAGAAPAWSAVWYVDKDHPTPGAGTSWATAFTTIQPAIDAASSAGGGEVWVAEGTYDEPRTDPTGALVLQTGVEIYGGFAGTEQHRWERSWATHVTTISGATSRQGSAAYHVVIGAEGAIIDGFVVRDGQAIGSGTDSAGAGLYNAHTSVAVANCTFANNLSYGSGAAMYNYVCSPSVTGCRFQNNSSRFNGGAVYNQSGSFVFTECEFRGNVANMGGAVHNFSISTISNFDRCTFAGNTAYREAGGLSGSSASITLTNCVLVGNTATGGDFGSGIEPGMGGAMLLNYGSAHFINCTLSRNAVQNGGTVGGIYNYHASVTLVNSILWGNTPDELFNDTTLAAITYSDVKGGYPGEGNIGSNVVLHDPDFVDAAGGNLRLTLGSPCIDSGTSSGAPAIDLVGAARPESAGFDMGAYEYYTPFVPPTVDFSADRTSGDPPLEVQFTNLTLQGTDVILGWAWDFGDGSATSTERDPFHLYTAQGHFTVTLTVTTASGSFAETKANYIRTTMQLPMAGTLGLGALAAAMILVGVVTVRRPSQRFNA